MLQSIDPEPEVQSGTRVVDTHVPRWQFSDRLYAQTWSNPTDVSATWQTPQPTPSSEWAWKGSRVSGGHIADPKSHAGPATTAAGDSRDDHPHDDGMVYLGGIGKGDLIGDEYANAGVNHRSDGPRVTATLRTDQTAAIGTGASVGVGVTQVPTIPFRPASVALFSGAASLETTSCGQGERGQAASTIRSSGMFSRASSHATPTLVSDENDDGWTRGPTQASVSRTRTRGCPVCTVAPTPGGCKCVRGMPYGIDVRRAVPISVAPPAVPPEVFSTVCAAMRLAEQPSTPDTTRAVVVDMYWALAHLVEKCAKGGDTRVDDVWKAASCLAQIADAPARGCVINAVAIAAKPVLFTLSDAAACIDAEATITSIHGQEFTSGPAGRWLVAMVGSGMLWRLLKGFDCQGFRATIGASTAFTGPTRIVLMPRSVLPETSQWRRHPDVDGDHDSDLDTGPDLADAVSDIEDGDNDAWEAPEIVTSRPRQPAQARTSALRVSMTIPAQQSRVSDHIRGAASPISLDPGLDVGDDGCGYSVAPDSDEDDADNVVGLLTGGRHTTPTQWTPAIHVGASWSQAFATTKKAPDVSVGTGATGTGTTGTVQSGRIKMIAPPRIGVVRERDVASGVKTFHYPMSGYVLHIHHKTTEAPFSCVCANCPRPKPGAPIRAPVTTTASAWMPTLRSSTTTTPAASAPALNSVHTLDTAVPAEVVAVLPGISERFGTSFPGTIPPRGVVNYSTDVRWDVTMAVAGPSVHHGLRTDECFHPSNPALMVQEGAWLVRLHHGTRVQKAASETESDALHRVVRGDVGIVPGMSFQLLKHDNAVYLMAVYHQTAIDFADRVAAWRLDCATGVAAEMSIDAAVSSSAARIRATKATALRIAGTLTGNGTVHSHTIDVDATWNTIRNTGGIPRWKEYRVFNGCYDLDAVPGRDAPLLLNFGRSHGWKVVTLATVAPVDTGGTHNTETLRCMPVAPTRRVNKATFVDHGVNQCSPRNVRVVSVSPLAQALDAASLTRLMAADPFFVPRDDASFSAFVLDAMAYVAFSDLVCVA
jgi:hypothetical protein